MGTDRATAMDARELQIMNVLFPHAYGERQRVIDQGIKLAHYASAETGIQILKNQEFWLRDSRCMNDFREVHHGLTLLEAFFRDASRNAAFVTAVNAVHAGVGEEVIRKFFDWKAMLWAGTYIMCMSEHRDKLDEKYGRLSMWRAYGRAAGGIAIVMNVPMGNTDTNFHVFLSPVAYKDEIDSDMSAIIGNMGAARQLLGSIPRDEFLNRLFSMLVMAAVCLKHPGFHEEREWRLVYLPLTWQSEFVKEAYEPIAGVPQCVYKLKFSEAVRAGHLEADPVKLIDRVIIGPTAYPGTVTDQVFQALRSLGFTQPGDHLETSYIPLRI
jgi:hypothetical protein